MLDLPDEDICALITQKNEKRRLRGCLQILQITARCENLYVVHRSKRLEPVLAACAFIPSSYCDVEMARNLSAISTMALQEKTIIVGQTDKIG